MKQSWIIAISFAIFGKLSESKDEDLSLPSNLLFGAASSAYQVEGAWNVSGKDESLWDRWVHTHPEAIADRSTGDIACDSYHKYKEDVQHIKSIGLDFYRFSISWTRIFKPGCANEINEEGLRYYKNFVAELIKHDIVPVVTIYHWDHPQYVEDMGGWINELIVDHFVSYARVLFKALGDKVKIWATVNEPNILCTGAYHGNVEPVLAPGKNLNNTGMYLCVHNVLKAHAKTYHMYDKEFRPTQHGQLGIVPQCWNYAAANHGDTVSTETAFQFTCGWIGHPIYHGDYPEIMKTRIAMVSKAEGCEKSRLPEFSKEWIETIKGTADYFGMNHYTTLLVAPDPDEKHGKYNTDMGLITSVHPKWPNSSAPWLRVVPWGLGDLLRWIKKEYNNPPVMIMENGFADHGELDDYSRIVYYHGYVRSLLKAVKEDRCNVRSYTMWSLMDNFEWNSGYTQKYGIISVDFNDPNRTRRHKLSTAWWKKVIAARELQPVPTKPRSANRGNRRKNDQLRTFI